MVSPKSGANAMANILMSLIMGGFSFWLVGFGLAYGPNTHGSVAFSGAGDYFFWNNAAEEEEAERTMQFFFELSFATTATTIVAGRTL